MKRAFPKKVKPVSPQTEAPNASVNFDASNMGLLRQANPDSNRRSRTSAAVIGLAISMGASSLFLPRQGDRAWAATEPNAGDASTTTALSSFDKASQPPLSEGATAPADVKAAMPSLPLESNPAPKEQTLLPAASAQIDATAVPSSPSFRPYTAEAAVPGTQNLSGSSASIEELSAGSTFGTTSESQGTPSLNQGQEVLQQPLSGQIQQLDQGHQEILKANQNAVILGWQQSEKPLQGGFEAELPSEQSANSSPVTIEPPPKDPAINFVKGSTSAVAESIAPTQAVNPNTANPSIPPIGIPAANPVTPLSPVLESGNPTSGSVGAAPSVPNIVPGVQTPSEKPAFVPVLPSAPDATAPQTKPRPLIVPVAPESPSQAQSLAPETETADRPLRASERVKQVKLPENVAVPDMSQAVVIANTGPQTVVIGAAEIQPAKIYRVNSGDTIDDIAKTYGVAETELVVANQLNDPNRIDVNQTLTIPLKQPSATTLMGGPSYLNLVTVRTDGVVAKPAPEVSNSLPLVSQVPSNSEKADISSEVESASTEEPGSNNPYVDRLRAEISKIREKSRAQKAGGIEVNVSAPTLPAVTDRPFPSVLNVPTAAPTVPSVLNSSLPNRYQNPEFNPNNSYGSPSLPSGVEARRQPNRPEIQPLAAPSAQETSVATPPVVATAPIGADSYDQGIQPRMVSPDLPPLAAPDTYLPKGSAVFTGYIWPAKGEFTSGFGWRWGRMHAGIDVAAPIGTPVVASAPGVITYAQWNDGGYGNLVEITHPDGSITLYAHNDRILVREGQQVEQGQQIAEMGSTGFSTGPHVHFEVHPRGQGAVDPIAYLPR